MTASEINESMNEASNRQPWWVATIATYGVPAVLMMLYYFQVYKPDQDSRRELDRTNSNTLVELSKTTQMLVDQDRRREQSTAEMLRIQSDQTRTMQEQTRILQQIMLDQRNGAWNEPKKPANGHAAGAKPEG
jgi:hypothetical protein